MRPLHTVVLWLALGCHEAPPAMLPPAAPTPDRCGPAVDHVFDVMMHSEQIGFAQRMILKAFASQAAAACREDPLDEAQAACLFAVHAPEDLATLEACPAMKTRPLPWLSLRAHAGTGSKMLK